MRSETSQKTINVMKRVNFGQLPLFLQLAHKTLEKGAPVGETDGQGGTKFILPKDMVQLSVVRPELLEAVEKIEVVYAKG